MLRAAILLAVAGFTGLGLLAHAGAAQDAPASPIANLPPGYLPREALPNSLALLPAPPAPGSAAMRRDEDARSSVLAFRDTPRWTLAGSDADLRFPHAASTFSCAAGIPISREQTPRLFGLLGKMLIDVGLSTYTAKNRYNRPRPFVVHQTTTCFPADEEALRHDGSYPSGHSAAGWGWALVLAELVPDKADAILQRGRDFGQSRLVCDVHWQSDIDAGRVIASGTVARLHSDPVFLADLGAARQEIAALGQQPDDGRCSAETAALSALP